MSVMRVGCAVCRCVLLTALVLGFVAMHHVPLPANHGRVPAATETYVAGPASHGCHTTAGNPPRCDDLPVAASHNGATPESGSLLLHLCVAVLISIAMAAIALPVGVPEAFASHRRVRYARGGSPLPSVPVPRRLSALCVLRL